MATNAGHRALRWLFPTLSGVVVIPLIPSFYISTNIGVHLVSCVLLSHMSAMEVSYHFVMISEII